MSYFLLFFLNPVDNEKDLVDIPENIKGKLDIKSVRWIDEVLDLALERPLVAMQKEIATVVTSASEEAPATKIEGEVKGDGAPLKH